MGRKQQTRGEAWERYIVGENALLAATGRALMQKVPTKTVVIRGKARRVKRNLTDFIGWLEPGGICVQLEAKQTSRKTSWQFSKIEPHQLEALRRLAAAGGVSFIYLRRTVTDGGISVEQFVLPVGPEGRIAGIDPETDRKSFPFDERAWDVFRVRRGECWLDAYDRISHFGPSEDEAGGGSR